MVTGTVPVQPQNEETVLALACSLYEQGARAESFRLLLRLSALGVKTAPLYYNQALCFEQAGQPDKALSCLEKALSCVTKKNGNRESLPAKRKLCKFCINNSASKLHIAFS